LREVGDAVEPEVRVEERARPARLVVREPVPRAEGLHDRARLRQVEVRDPRREVVLHLLVEADEREAEEPAREEVPRRRELEEQRVGGRRDERLRDVRRREDRREVEAAEERRREVEREDGEGRRSEEQ